MLVARQPRREGKRDALDMGIVPTGLQVGCNPAPPPACAEETADVLVAH
jgi:hypothetical protein